MYGYKERGYMAKWILYIAAIIIIGIGGAVFYNWTHRDENKP